MLLRLDLENFKSFRKESVSPIKPLTVLTGPNNAGKSSVLQAAHFLANSVIGNNFQYGDIGFVLSNFFETVHKHDRQATISIRMAFDFPDDLRQEMIPFLKGQTAWNLKKGDVNSADSVTYSLEFATNNLPEREQIALGGKVLMDYEAPSGGFSFPYLGGGTGGIGHGGGPLTFPVVGGVQYEHFVGPAREIITQGCRSIHYFGPDRRANIWSASVAQEPIKVGYRGENTVTLLHYLFSNESKTFERIASWVHKFDVDIERMMSPLRQGATVVILESGEVEHNIAMMGFGLAQVLPIIVQACDSPPGSIFLIEEPEIHIHPEAQEVLLDFFTEMTGEGKQFIFTTHSISLLNSLRWRLADGRIDREILAGFDVSIENGESHVEPVDVTEKQWPAFDRSMRRLQGKL